MSYYVVDVESDGPVPVMNSMVCFGAVRVTDDLKDTFYGKTKPISDIWQPEALSISGFSREEHEGFDDPKGVMQLFYDWIMETNGSGRPTMFSDNIAYDWQWINYYFHFYLGKNPFGWSGRRIGDVYCGIKGDPYAKWKYLRKTAHTHDPVDDAKGNAEALLAIRDMGIKFKFK